MDYMFDAGFRAGVKETEKTLVSEREGYGNTISGLEKEIAALRAKYDELLVVYNDQVTAHGVLNDKCAALRAENLRLKESVVEDACKIKILLSEDKRLWAENAALRLIAREIATECKMPCTGCRFNTNSCVCRPECSGCGPGKSSHYALSSGLIEAARSRDEPIFRFSGRAENLAYRSQGGINGGA